MFCIEAAKTCFPLVVNYVANHILKLLEQCGIQMDASFLYQGWTVLGWRHCTHLRQHMEIRVFKCAAPPREPLLISLGSMGMCTQDFYQLENLLPKMLSDTSQLFLPLFQCHIFNYLSAISAWTLQHSLKFNMDKFSIFVPQQWCYACNPWFCWIMVNAQLPWSWSSTHHFN